MTAEPVMTLPCRIVDALVVSAMHNAWSGTFGPQEQAGSAVPFWHLDEAVTCEMTNNLTGANWRAAIKPCEFYELIQRLPDEFVPDYFKAQGDVEYP